MPPFSSERLARLAEDEANRKAETARAKRFVWKRLKAVQPDLCDHLTRMSEVFDAKVLRIEIDGKPVLELPEAVAQRALEQAQAKRIARLERELRECLEAYDGYHWAGRCRLMAQQGVKSCHDDTQMT